MASAAQVQSLSTTWFFGSHYRHLFFSSCIIVFCHLSTAHIIWKAKDGLDHWFTSENWEFKRVTWYLVHGLRLLNLYIMIMNRGHLILLIGIPLIIQQYASVIFKFETFNDTDIFLVRCIFLCLHCWMISVLPLLLLHLPHNLLPHTLPLRNNHLNYLFLLSVIPWFQCRVISLPKKPLNDSSVT